jgi:hypothetical protein
MAEIRNDLGDVVVVRVSAPEYSRLAMAPHSAPRRYCGVYSSTPFGCRGRKVSTVVDTLGRRRRPGDPAASGQLRVFVAHELASMVSVSENTWECDMSKRIRDEFTDLEMSRQQKYQLRMRRDGRCIICGENAAVSGLCLEHLVARRERTRRKLGCRRRSKAAKSYRLQEQAVPLRASVSAGH